jgi:hypothetical protein
MLTLLHITTGALVIRNNAVATLWLFTLDRRTLTLSSALATLAIQELECRMHTSKCTLHSTFCALCSVLSVPKFLCSQVPWFIGSNVLRTLHFAVQ